MSKQDNHFVFKMDAVTYRLDFDCTWEVEKACLDAAGMVPHAAAAKMEGNASKFLIAVLVFAARMQMGKPAPFKEVADAITMDSIATLEILEQGEGDSPKAQGSSTRADSPA